MGLQTSHCKVCCLDSQLRGFLPRRARALYFFAQIIAKRPSVCVLYRSNLGRIAAIQQAALSIINRSPRHPSGKNPQGGSGSRKSRSSHRIRSSTNPLCGLRVVAYNVGFAGTAKSLCLALERWLSGRKRRFAKPMTGKLVRRFESCPLRCDLKWLPQVAV